MKGLEPPRHTAQDPKSCAATSYATSACIPLKRGVQRYEKFVNPGIDLLQGLDC